MMTNPLVMQKNGFASVIGTGKPAAAMEGMGMDFLALLESMDALPAEGEMETGPVSAAPVPHGGEFLAPASSALSMPLPAEGLPLKAEVSEGVPAVLPTSDPALSEADVPAHLPIEKALVQPAAAKLAGTASALPHLALAMSHRAEAAPAEATRKSEKADSESREMPETSVDAPAAGDGLALSLLQKVEQLAPVSASGSADGKDDAVGALPDDPQAAALKAFALPPAALRQAAALPDQAADPAQQQALERLQAVPKDMATPEMAPASEKAAFSSAVHQKVEKPADDAPISTEFVSAEVNERATAPVNRRAAAAQPAETAAVYAAPVNIASAPLAPVIQPPLIDAAAAPLVSAPVLDTAAQLGEQVIDMGVDGQWIDRMAREIADISAGTGRASFTLNPDNLGRLQVEILQRDEGADVRLIAETDDAVTALQQGRQQLQQDGRLQAARINDVQIERSSGNSDSTTMTRTAPSGQELAQQQSQSQSQAFHKKPQIESVSSMARGEEPGEEADSAISSRNARYA